MISVKLKKSIFIPLDRQNTRDQQKYAGKILTLLLKLPISLEKKPSKINDFPRATLTFHIQ